MKTMAVKNPQTRVGKFLAKGWVAAVALGVAWLSVIEMGLSRTLGG